MLDAQRSQIVITSIITFLFGSILLAGAVISNSTINSTVNETLDLNESNNGYLMDEPPIENLSINLTSSNASASGNESPSSSVLGNTPNIAKKGLAKLLNEDNLDFDRNYKAKYLLDRNNFSDMDFEIKSVGSILNLKTGARQDNLKGVKLNDKDFAIDLVSCDSYERYCTFRINGVPTKKMFGSTDFGNARKHSFDLDENYSIKVNSIVFDFCDNRRFCHLGMEAYHVVNMSIERK